MKKSNVRSIHEEHYLRYCQNVSRLFAIIVMNLPDPYRTHCITFWSSFIELGTYVSLVQEVQKVQNGN